MKQSHVVPKDQQLESIVVIIKHHRHHQKLQKSAGKSSKSSKSTPLNVNSKIFSSKSICTSGNKSAKEVQTLLSEEIKQLESRLEKQISKTNVLEKELEGLKKENSFLKTEFQSQNE